MKVNWLLQMDKEDENTFSNVLKRVSDKSIKKIYMVISCIKDTGFKVIEEELYGLKSATKALIRNR